jgi:hypothetical protein
MRRRGTLAICGIHINKEGKILLVKRGETFILPGGQPEGREKDKECLLREIRVEELPNLKKITVGKWFGKFNGRTPFTNEPLHVRVYWLEIENGFEPGAEISESGFFTHFDCVNSIKISGVTRQIVDILKERGYLK